MGGSTSKAVSKIVNNAVADVTTKNYIGCSSQVLNDINVEMVNVGLSYGQSQTVEQATTVSMSCMQDARKTTSLQNDISNAIEQAVKAQSGALNIGPSTSKAISDMKNTIRSKITTANIVEAHNSVVNQLRARQINIGVQVGGSQTISQKTAIIVKAVQNLIESTDIVNSIANALDQDAESTQTGPFDFLTDIFGSFAILGVVFLIVVGILAYFFLRGGGFGNFQSSGLITGAPSLSGALRGAPAMPSSAPPIYATPTGMQSQSPAGMPGYATSTGIQQGMPAQVQMGMPANTVLPRPPQIGTPVPVQVGMPVRLPGRPATGRARMED